MWCNTAVRERMEGRSAHAIPGEIAGLIERTDGICRMMIGKVTGIEKALPVMTTQIVAELLPAMISAAMASQTIAVRRGRTAGQLLQDHGYKVKRLSCWFSYKLRELGLEIDGGGKGELGLSTAHLFDPDKVGVWMRNGGRTIVDRKVSERQGQGKLRLI
ncbi:hypothetical protein CTI14_00375 [Methylobacterium radiotolerans]|nr:hypothetical protein CTI14_00375 [Methylobacterium radiotolerans]